MKTCALGRPGPCEHAERDVAGSEAEAVLCICITLGAVELLGDQYIGYKSKNVFMEAIKQGAERRRK